MADYYEAVTTVINVTFEGLMNSPLWVVCVGGRKNPDENILKVYDEFFNECIYDNNSVSRDFIKEFLLFVLQIQPESSPNYHPDYIVTEKIKRFFESKEEAQ